MNSPLFSIIVPIYNVETYLSACLDSLLSQSLGDFELLLIDDGSTDLSLSIAQDYAARDTRIRLFTQANAGQSVARNRGLDEARGRYIVFVDSDDMLREGALAYYAEVFASKPEVEILYTEYELADNNGAVLGRQKFWFDIARFGGGVWSGDRLLASLESQKAALFTYTWQGAIRRDFLESHKLRFYEGIFFEDILFGFSAFSAARAVFVSTQCFYLYRQSPNSTTRGKQSLEKCIRSAHAYITTALELLALADSMQGRVSKETYQFYFRAVRTLCKRVMRIARSIDDRAARDEIVRALRPLRPYAPLRTKLFLLAPHLF